MMNFQNMSRILLNFLPLSLAEEKARLLVVVIATQVHLTTPVYEKFRKYFYVKEFIANEEKLQDDQNLL